MNAGFMSQRVVVDVGNYIGKFVESDNNNFVGVWREYLRVRATIDLDKPLKRRMKLRKSQDIWSWVNFRYEGVPTFCFICGMIGHGEKFCEKIFDTPMEEIEKPYGVWMKAEPRRRTHTMRAKWLRQCGKDPAMVPVETTAELGREISSTKDAGNDKDPVNAGNRIDMATSSKNMVVGGKNGTGGFSGENISQPTFMLANEISADKDIASNEEIGLQISDPKRRRIEKPKESGPGEK